MPLAVMAITTQTDKGELIILNRYYVRFNSLTIFTLLHEMAHIALYEKDRRTEHGPRWQSEMLRLAKQGAFRELW